MEAKTVVASNRKGSPASAGFARVYTRMGDVEAKVDKLSQDFDIYKMSNQRVEGKLDELMRLIGKEEEDGSGGYTGTGLVGRVRRSESSVEALMQKYKAWIAWGTGFCTALMAAVAVIWWLVADKMEIVFKGSGQ